MEKIHTEVFAMDSRLAEARLKLVTMQFCMVLSSEMPLSKKKLKGGLGGGAQNQFTFNSLSTDSPWFTHERLAFCP